MAAASERGFGEYGRSIAGDVESPSLLPLLLLLLLLPSLSLSLSPPPLLPLPLPLPLPLLRLSLPYEGEAISAAP